MEELKEKALFWESLLIRGFGILIFSAIIFMAIDYSKVAILSLFLSLLSLIAYCFIGILESCFLEEKVLPILRLIRVSFLLLILSVTGYIFIDLFGNRIVNFLYSIDIKQNYEELKEYFIL